MTLTLMLKDTTPLAPKGGCVTIVRLHLMQASQPQKRNIMLKQSVAMVTVSTVRALRSRAAPHTRKSRQKPLPTSMTHFPGNSRTLTS
jgi:hypothetical protein